MKKKLGGVKEMFCKLNDNHKGITYLQVTLELVNDGVGSAFEGYMRELLPTFKKERWKLRVAAKRYTNDPSSGSLPPTPPALRYLHVWEVPNMNTLPDLMKAFSDDETYHELDALVAAETQDFFGGSYPEAYPKPVSHKTLLRLTIHLVQDKVEKFNTFMGELQYSDWKRFSWAPEHVSYAQTGRLRRQCYIWSTDAEQPNAQGAIEWLLKQPEFNQALDQASVPPLAWEQWERVSYGQG